MIFFAGGGLLLLLMLFVRHRRRKGKRTTSTDALADVLGVFPTLPRLRHRPYKGRWWL